MKLLELYLRRIAREEAEIAIRLDRDEREARTYVQGLKDDLQEVLKERNQLRSRVLELERGSD